MKTRQLFPATALALLIAAAGQSVVHARDTDIYLKAADLTSVTADRIPSILLILDSSGSMATSITGSRLPYDPSRNYCAETGAPAGTICNGTTAYDRIFWAFNGVTPTATSTNYFTQNATSLKNRCVEAQDVFALVGRYPGSKIAAFQVGSGWKSLNGLADADITYVDCAADNASTSRGNTSADGLTSDDTLFPVLATTAAGAYGSTSIDAFNWTAYASNAEPVLYSANYLAFALNTNTGNSNIFGSRTRMEVARAALKEVVEMYRGVKFGLMVFNQNGGSGPNGGRVISRIAHLDATGRTNMKSTIDSVSPGGFTPLSETFWEAFNYIAGRAVDFGDDATSPSPARDTSAESGGSYITPQSYGCESTYAIYITDGDPTNDTDADTKIRNFINSKTGTTPTCVGNVNETDDSTTSCLKDLSGWMQNNDMNDGVAARQTVTTYMIGFGTGISLDGKALLQDTANRGGGQYWEANDAGALSTAFQSALGSIGTVNTSFASPSITVNAFNRLYNGDSLYLAMFQPSRTVAWGGNVKKLYLCNQDDVDAGYCVFGEIVDRNKVPAIDGTGKIKSTADTEWPTTADDGVNVIQGGAGAKLPTPATRRGLVRTYLTAYSGLPAAGSAGMAIDDSASATGTSTVRALARSNPTLLGLPAAASGTDVDNLMKWILGDTDNAMATRDRWAFADPLHASPVPVTYGKTSTDEPVVKLFVASNDGVIRMINDRTGVEEWAFIPKEMLSQQNLLRQDANGDHINGLDGAISIWMVDNNNDGIINPTAGTDDKVYMFVTQRRGGRNIYGFDVTPSATLTAHTGTFTPKLLWVIEGGTGDYAKLGQTWGKAQVARIRYQCTGTVCDDGDSTTNDSEARTVLIFGGGYDTNQDNAIPSTTDSMGNAIYIADPKTGARLWWAGNVNSGPGPTQSNLYLAKMSYSIPSDLTLIDSNADGSVDRIYVGDTGGQLWRIDLGTQIGTTAHGSSGYVFADFGCTGGTRNADGSCTAGTMSVQNRRKFFYPPDVAPVSDSLYSNVATYDLVTIGSGDREDPLDLLTSARTTGREAVHNRIYAVRDYDIKSGAPPAARPAITESSTDLYDATDNDLGTATGTALSTEIAEIKAKKGWFIDFKEPSTVTLPNGLTTNWVGEKVLAKTVIFGGVLYVTTYVPASTSTASTTCQPSEGEGRLYAINYLTGVPEFDFNSDGTDDRYTTAGGGIPSEAVIVIREDGTTGLVGASGGAVKIPADFPNAPIRTFWYEE